MLIRQSLNLSFNGVDIDWEEHARSGIPITVATLLLSGIWLYLLK